MKSLITALMICTLSAGAWAEKGLINETRTDANGQKTIIIKDYRPKKQRPLKRATPQFKEYDLGSSEADYASTPVNVNYAPPPQQQQQSAPQPVQRVQSYSQTYAPGPNASMTPGGGGGSFGSTVLPTYPAYGPWYGYGYGYGYNGCNRPYYPAQYPATYPGFLPGQPSGPPYVIGYPVFNTVSPPRLPGAGRCR